MLKKSLSQPKGIGKFIYPIRTLGYLFGAAALLAYHNFNNLPWLTHGLIFIFIGYPHLAYILYRKNNFPSRMEFTYLSFDLLLVGLFASQVGFALIPTFSYLVVVSSTIVSLNGFLLLARSLLFFLAGSTLGGLTTNFYFDGSPPLSVDLISLGYLVVGSWAHNYFNFYRGQRYIKARDQIKKQNTIIENNLQEKELLLKEIHHRVKNNLQLIHSLLNLQKQYINEPQALEALTNSQLRIKSMSLVHKKLYESENLKEVNISRYLHDLILHIAEGDLQTTDKNKIILSIEEASLPLNTAIPLGLIMTELVHNAFKYAFNTPTATLKIDGRAFESEYKISMADKGPGITCLQANHPDFTSLGLQLVYDLIKQLHGTITYTYEDGSKFNINIPIGQDG